MATQDEILSLYPDLTTCGLNQVRTCVTEFNPNRIEFLRKLIRLMIASHRSYKVGSYGGKHAMERPVKFYFTNGEFILAMLMEGYPMRRDGINCVFKARYLVPDVGVPSGYILDWTPEESRRQNTMDALLFGRRPVRQMRETKVDQARRTLKSNVEALLDETIPTWREGDIYTKLAASLGEW